MARPDSTEYAPDYEGYVSRVGNVDDIVTTLVSDLETTLTLLRSVTEERGNYRYAPGKWSLKEVVGHMVDAERIFAYRALRFARNDASPLPGFDQDPYVVNASFDSCKLQSLVGEFEHVRRANVIMFRHLPLEAWDRRGIASENPISVRALAYIIAGHERHHIAVIRERYLQG